MAGPIGRSTDLLKQYCAERTFNYNKIKKGLLLIAWGGIKKGAIADRTAIFVNQIYTGVGEGNVNYTGIIVFLASIAYSIQIYCDFSGYSDIAKGVAECLGIELQTNFQHPYFARSISEFWHRWHISLSTWLKDYLYIPLGGNKKGKVRRDINLLLVFLISGFWHGTDVGKY